jgi:hypothetical protein
LHFGRDRWRRLGRTFPYQGRKHVDRDLIVTVIFSSNLLKSVDSTDNNLRLTTRNLLYSLRISICRLASPGQKERLGGVNQASE